MGQTLGVTFDDLERWARGHASRRGSSPPAVLLGRLVQWPANRLVARSEHRDAQDHDAGLVPSEAAKHEAALVQVVAWSLIGMSSTTRR